MLLPAVQAAREAARRMQCTNHLKQLSLAVHNYHDTYNTLPPLSARSTSQQGNYRKSWRVLILPFFEQTALADLIAGGGAATSAAGSWPSQPGGVNIVPWDTDYLPWRAFIATYHCPSDGNCTASPAGSGTPNPANYRACLGDMEFPWSNSTGAGGRWSNNQDRDLGFRGSFDGYGKGMSAISDGLSNTLLFGETCVEPEGGQGRKAKGGLALKMIPIDVPNACIANLDAGDRTQFAASVNPAGGWFGRRWADGITAQSGFHAHLPPNAPSCAYSNDTNAHIAASSNHPGGANVSRGDGSCSFVSETVNTGDLSKCAYLYSTPDGLRGDPPDTPPYGGVSLFGVWGAMGSCNGGESVSAP